MKYLAGLPFSSINNFISLNFARRLSTVDGLMFNSAPNCFFVRPSSENKDACIKIVKDHLFAGKILRDDIPQGKYLTQEGGDVYTTLSGKSIWMGLFYEDYGNVVEGGVRVIYLKEDVTIDIASSNIQPTNGVVHSLSYNYVLGGL